MNVGRRVTGEMSLSMQRAAAEATAMTVIERLDLPSGMLMMQPGRTGPAGLCQNSGRVGYDKTALFLSVLSLQL
ncbi:hypothetical protein FDV58_27440 [Bradyrhizobium elkanii]|uniref:Uncharacterized protein n=1 Tax=Bradyrhizobium elkanii TaxID=29448 RepID=A0A4U6RXB0_BRAEL|nr:hypothetical protein [Bradyrhizobium elkanii]TKV78272.1 hypothetical protein FDV58_27440 [Bradyrhizobium elkanii]